MLAELIKKREYWTLEKIQEFSAPLTMANNAIFAWDWDDSGYYYVTPDYLEYNNLDTGECFSINSTIRPDEWNLYRQTFILAGNTNKNLRVELPLSREIVEVNGFKFEYIETRFRGSRETKFSFFNQEESLYNVADDVYNLLAVLKEIAKENNTGLPFVLLINRVRTDNVFTWRRIRGNWKLTLEQTIENLLLQLDGYLRTSGSFFREGQSQTIKEECSNKWRQLL